MFVLIKSLSKFGVEKIRFSPILCNFAFWGFGCHPRCQSSVSALHEIYIVLKISLLPTIALWVKQWKCIARGEKERYLSCAIESDSAFNLFLVPCVIGCVYLQGMNKQCLSGEIIPYFFISKSGCWQSAADVNCNNLSALKLISFTAYQLIG